jgi:hypothetical protein
MKIHLLAVLAGASLLLAAPVLAKPARETHMHVSAHHARHVHADRRYAQSYYDYRSASSVRESFRDGPSRDWREARGHWQGGYREQRDGLVVENLRGDFNGGVGYGTDGDLSFTDGYGQVHFFTGSFAPRPGFGPNRFGPHRFGPRQFGPGHGFTRGR